MYDDDELQRVLALSMQQSGGNSYPSDEERQVADAIALSLQEPLMPQQDEELNAALRLSMEPFPESERPIASASGGVPDAQAMLQLLFGDTSAPSVEQQAELP
jgi:hypothetical protein